MFALTKHQKLKKLNLQLDTLTRAHGEYYIGESEVWPDAKPKKGYSQAKMNKLLAGIQRVKAKIAELEESM